MTSDNWWEDKPHPNYLRIVRRGAHLISTLIVKLVLWSFVAIIILVGLYLALSKKGE